MPSSVLTATALGDRRLLPFAHFAEEETKLQTGLGAHPGSQRPEQSLAPGAVFLTLTKELDMLHLLCGLP